MKIKVNIKSRMAYLGITRNNLADEIGLSRVMLTNYMQGNTAGITFDIMAKLCVSLKCTPNDLFELVDE